MDGIHAEKPPARGKRSRESKKNVTTACGENTVPMDVNNKLSYLDSVQNHTSNQSAESSNHIVNESVKASNAIQLWSAKVDGDNVSAAAFDEPPRSDVRACTSSSHNAIDEAATLRGSTEDDTLLAFILQNKAKRKRRRLDGDIAAHS